LRRFTVRSFAVAGALSCVLATSSSARRAAPRFYLGGAGGVQFLTGDVSGDVVDSRANGAADIAVGYQITPHWLTEFSYGFEGSYREDRRYIPLDQGENPSDAERAFQVRTNPLFFRTYFTRSSFREEYVKLQWSLALGWVQVSRLLRNPPGVPPFDTSQLLAAAEFGGAALFVFSKNFSGFVGARYRITERRGIVDQTHDMDSLSIVLGFRSFLPSPRDVAEPDPDDRPKR